MNGSSSHGSAAAGGSSPTKPLISAIPTRLQPRTTAESTSSNTEPTIQQLLAQTSLGSHTRMTTDGSSTSNGDAAAPSSTAAAVGMASWRKGQGFKAWETELLKSAEVKRKADVAQLCKCTCSLSVSPGLTRVSSCYADFLE